MHLRESIKEIRYSVLATFASLQKNDPHALITGHIIAHSLLREQHFPGIQDLLQRPISRVSSVENIKEANLIDRPRLEHG
jgi:hypothetical protein